MNIRHSIPDEFPEWQAEWLSQLPSADVVRQGMTDLFRDRDAPAIVDRELNMSWSTSPSEVVTCRFANGSEERILCKYLPLETSGHGDHRGGLAYEAQVYGELLAESPSITPAFFGTWHDPTGRWTCLAMEYLDGATRLHKVLEPGMPQAAARWIGAFHAHHDRQVRTAPRFLRRYDRSYYSHWATRTRAHVAQLEPHAPWLPSLLAQSSRWIDTLLVAPSTAIHGEYYPDNILVRNSQPYPVDWESAAVAPGEVDVAALTGGEWPASVSEGCERAYVESRWPDGATPEHFDLTLAAARMYLHFRWLGDDRVREMTEHVYRRLAQLQRDAERLHQLLERGEEARPR